MHHFTNRIKKKLWYHLALPLGSALITVALLDMIASCAYVLKDYIDTAPVALYKAGTKNSIPPGRIGLIEIFQWIYVTYKVILSLILCIGGIFMGRRLIVITWLMVSMMVDIVHLSESIYIFSRPNLITTWSLFLTVGASIWGEVKIVRIKYRIIRRALTTTTILRTFGSEDHGGLLEMSLEKCEEKEEQDYQETSFFSYRFDVVSLVKLSRNLYNLLTWQLTNFLWGDDFHKLIKNNHSAVMLEQNFIRYAHIFLDSLTIVYIIQEKKWLLTPWITAYLIGFSAVVAVSILVMIQFNLMTYVFSIVYYIVMSIDLVLRSGCLIYCLRLIIKTRHLI